MKKILFLLFPYQRRTYMLNVDQRYFEEKVERFVKDSEVNYAPGKHYIYHDKAKKEFSFRRKMLNPGSGSGGIFRFSYEYKRDHVEVNSRMGYSIFLYVLFVFSCLVTWMIAYIPVNLFFQMEAFIVKDDFEKYFKEDIQKNSHR